MSLIARPGSLTFPPVDYATLPPECQTPEFQTPEGRMVLAREYVVARTNLFEGIEPGTPVEVRLRRVWKYCQKEIQTAFDDRDAARFKKEEEDYVNSLNPLSRGLYKVVIILTRAHNFIHKEGPVRSNVVCGISLLILSGGFFFIENNPSTALVIVTGVGSLLGIALICASIFSVVKQQYFQQREE